MNSDLPLFRPFEPLEFAERSPEEVEAGVVREADGHAALQSMLAATDLASVTAEAAGLLLWRFGLGREQRRKILVELWQHAYKKLLFVDDHVDAGEAEYLSALQRALGLSNEEIRRARAEVPDVETG